MSATHFQLPVTISDIAAHAARAAADNAAHEADYAARHPGVCPKCTGLGCASCAPSPAPRRGRRAVRP